MANLPRSDVRRLPVIAEAIFCPAVISMPSVCAWSSDEETMVDPAKASSALGDLSWFVIVLAVEVGGCVYCR